MVWELTGAWSMAVAVGISYMWQVTGDMWLVLNDTWHATHYTWYIYINQTRCSRQCSTITSVTDWLIDSFIRWSFSSKSSKHHKDQSVRARELNIWDNVHHPMGVMCHVSYVVSSVMCHVLRVTNHFSSSSSLLFTSYWNIQQTRHSHRLILNWGFPS